MFIFGHLGIGKKLAFPWRKSLDAKFLLLGCVLPDLIDKPLYHGLAFFFGHDAMRQSLISGTRTFGHTALLLLIVVAIAYFRRSRVFAAIGLGMATHLLIDNVGDRIQLFLGLINGSSPNGLHALFWPLLGWQFPIYPAAFPSSISHLSTLRDPWIIFGELAGLSILIWDWYRSRRSRAGRSAAKVAN